MSSIGIQQRQLDGTAGGVALAVAIVARHRRQSQTLRQTDRVLEVGAVLELFGKVASLEQDERRVDALAGRSTPGPAAPRRAASSRGLSAQTRRRATVARLPFPGRSWPRGIQRSALRWGQGAREPRGGTRSGGGR